MAIKEKIYEDLKCPEKPLKEQPKSTQDLIEVEQISPNGIIKCRDRKYSKQYYMEDISYDDLTYEEQVQVFKMWMRIINSIDMEFKVTIFNQKRDMEHFRKKILYQYHNDIYDNSRMAYNDIIENKIVDGRQGNKQVKYLTIIVKRDTYKDAKAALLSMEATLIKTFNSLNSVLIPLNGTERLKVLHAFYRMGEEASFHADVPGYILDGGDWKNDIAPDSMKFERNGFKINNRIHGKAFYFDPHSYPNSLDDDFIKKLTDVPACGILSIDYIPIPKPVAQKIIDNKYMAIENKISKQQQKRNQSKAYSSDISYRVRLQKEQIEDTLKEFKSKDQKAFFVGVSMVLLDEDEENLRNAFNYVNSVAEEKTCSIRVCTDVQRQGINTVLPTGSHQIHNLRFMSTRCAAILMPFVIKGIYTDINPMYYGINSVSKEPILFNRKLLANGNGFVFGVSGGGKSMTGAKLEIGSVFLTTEDEIIIIDPTLEYEDVSNAFGGTFFDISINSKNYANPLDVDLTKLQLDDANGIIRDKCDFMVSICEHCLGDEFRVRYRSVIDRAVRNMYREVAMLPVEERKMPIMSDFYRHLKQLELQDAEDIAQNMEIFIEGSLNLFNHETNMKTDNRVTVYGMRDMKNLEGIAMLVILETLKKKIIENFEKGICTWIYIDEIHVLLKRPYSRNYLIELWKMVRKLGGLCTGITQNVIELLKDPETSTLISNSEYTMFLKQAAPDMAILTTAFEGISPAQLEYVSTAVPGTGLIRFGNNIQPMDNQIEKTNPIYDIFNTNPHEKAAQRRQVQGGM